MLATIAAVVFAAQALAPSAAPDAVTYTGCLVRGSRNTYVLVVPATRPASPPAGAAAPRDRAGVSTPEQRFQLSGTARGFNPRLHVNHLVEITGTLPARGRQAAPGVRVGQDGGPPLQSLTMRSGRVIADTCTTQRTTRN